MKNELTDEQIDELQAKRNADYHAGKITDHRSYARAVIAAHEALQAGQEPVAWRVRYRSPPEMLGHYPWSYTERKPKLPSDTTREVESVYAAPQPAPDKDAEIERLNKKARAYKALTESLESRISIYASRAEQSQEAIKTLASERQANMMLTAEVAMMDAEIAALRKDAMRYRWLRSEADRQYVEFAGSRYESREGLDFDIDVAIAQAVQAEDECWCDKQGIGEPGVSCGDCPRDYSKARAVQP